MQCVKIHLLPNSLDRVREWATTLNTSRRAEALATLADESVVLEAAFLDRTSEGDFLIYIMKAESFDTARQAAETSLHEIDAYHQAFKRDTWGTRTELELLLDLDRTGQRPADPGDSN
jgi:hypothetical protein